MYFDSALMLETFTVRALRSVATPGGFGPDAMWEVLWNCLSDIDTIETAAGVHLAKHLIIIALDILELLHCFGG